MKQIYKENIDCFTIYVLRRKTRRSTFWKKIRCRRVKEKFYISDLLSLFEFDPKGQIIDNINFV